MSEDQRPFIFTSDLLGYVAMWSTRQSPYLAPDGLTEVLSEFKKRADKRGFETCQDFVFVEATRENLLKILKEDLLTLPQVLAWNERKNGNKARFSFVSRYGKPHPDNDFIDLDALTGNIIRSCLAHATDTRDTGCVAV
jgi:hypothetical protein